MVEFALCLPLLVLLVFGSIEATNAIFLQQAISVAAYETAQLTTASGGTSATARERCKQILEARKIRKGTIEISPEVDATTIPGTAVTVTITVPANENSIGPVWYFKDSVITAQVTMAKL